MHVKKKKLKHSIKMKVHKMYLIEKDFQKGKMK